MLGIDLNASSRGAVSPVVPELSIANERVCFVSNRGFVGLLHGLLGDNSTKCT